MVPRSGEAGDRQRVGREQRAERAAHDVTREAGGAGNQAGGNTTSGAGRK
jgi:hypothetical protein